MRRPLSALMAATIALSLPMTAVAEELVILHTNDVHDHLQAYQDRDGTAVGGVGTRAAFLKRERQAHPNNLVLDAGDIFQGTPLYTFFKGEVDMKAMSAVGYDAAAMGNHDLDDGWSNLKKQLAFARFPMLCANVTTDDGDPVLLPGMTFLRGQNRIGVIGLLGDDAWMAVAVNSRKGLKHEAIIPAARRWVQAMRGQVDLLMLLTHNGKEEDVALAKAVPGIDVIVGGHSHTPLKEPILVANGNANGIGGTIILQAGCYGRYAGRLALDVGQGRINAFKGDLVTMSASLPASADNAATWAVAPYAAQVAQQMSEVLGTCPGGLPSIGKYGGETPLGNWLADMVKEAGRAEVGIINSGGIRAELPAGPVTVGRVFEILPFENFVASMNVPGQDLIDLAATVVERLHAHKSGTMQVSGLSFRGRNGKLAGPVLVGGKPIEPERRYRVAAIDYILGGGEGRFFKNRSDVNTGTVRLRDLMIARVKSQRVVQAPASGRITLEPAESGH